MGIPKKNGGETVDSYCYTKVWRVKAVYQQMTLSPWLGAAGIIIRLHFRSPLLIQIFISVAFSPRPLGIGMHIRTLLSLLLKVLRMELLSSLLWWELGTNLPRHGPGVCLSFWRVTSEWLSFRRFTSKLSWPVTILILRPMFLLPALKFLKTSIIHGISRKLPLLQGKYMKILFLKNWQDWL